MATIGAITIIRGEVDPHSTRAGVDQTTIKDNNQTEGSEVLLFHVLNPGAEVGTTINGVDTKTTLVGKWQFKYVFQP